MIIDHVDRHAAAWSGLSGTRADITRPGPTRTPMSADVVVATSEDFMDRSSSPSGHSQAPGVDAEMQQPQVGTTGGVVRGRTHSRGVLEFLGIPYGAPTGGEGRFRPPTPVSWTGVRDALEHGPSCPQPFGGDDATLAFFGGAEEPSQSEDCLVLNVWTPAADQGRRPVLVYLHGGGHVTGSGSWPAYQGAAMATRDAVVVTINHRLSALGYLDLEELLGADYAASGTCGMLDVVAALEWVRDNAHAFGGDSSNVTVFGESGGGSKVVTLLAMPAAEGLFHRAVIQSGWFGLRCPTREQAAVTTQRFLDELGLSRERAREVLTMPTQRLVEAVNALGGLGSGLEPVVDGVHIVSQPMDAVRAGALREIPLIIGSTHHEYSIFLPYITAAMPGDPIEASRTYLSSVFGPRVDDVVSSYRDAMPGAAEKDVLIAVATDGHVREPAIRLAQDAVTTGADVYFYRFDF
ncbi:MAG: carboxylesterase/lipase family protein, partial [Janthinobacterium lividum]